MIYGLQVGMPTEAARTALTKLPDLVFDRCREEMLEVRFQDKRIVIGYELVDGTLSRNKVIANVFGTYRPFIRRSDLAAWKAAIPELRLLLASEKNDDPHFAPTKYDLDSVTVLVMTEGIHTDDSKQVIVRTSEGKVDSVEFAGEYAAKLFKAADMSERDYAKAVMDGYGVPELNPIPSKLQLGQSIGYEYEEKLDGWQIRVWASKKVELIGRPKMKDRGFGK